MPSKSFLKAEEILRAQELLKQKNLSVISSFMDRVLLERLSQHPRWQESRPYALGSWARNELCARSDIDLIFIGEESHVKELTSDFLAEGLKIRYRMPADQKDWTVGVLPFDVLAILSARCFFETDEAELKNQQDKINDRGLKYKNQLFNSMMKERNERALRYDSISNYLEPNLKYGPGGLRDLEQGIMIYNLFKAEKFTGTTHISQDMKKKSKIEMRSFDHPNILKLKGLKEQLLLIRHWLHLNGVNDVLASTLQHDLARFFGVASLQDFMTQVEAHLSEVSFFADWVAARVQTPKLKLQKIENLKIKSFSQALNALKNNSSILMQEHVRIQSLKIKNKQSVGPLLLRYFNSQMSDGFVQALFRSQLLDQCVPQLRRLRGYFQHDQYHRYSVEAHSMQAVREVLRIKKKPKRLGCMARWAQNLSTRQWDVLVWSALYHDLGKGLQGDHSTEGAEIVIKDFKALNLPTALEESVSWMVKNHLIVSNAAFRQNPNSSTTWSELFKRGVQGERIPLLILFTAIDIVATNPEAWNEWKASLLFQLGQALMSPEAGQLSLLLETSKRIKIKLDKMFIENMDPRVIESVAHTHLLKDYAQLKKGKGDLEILVIKNRKKEIWIRFHSRIDRAGLFLSFAQQLHALGLSVQEAFALTHPEWGAYDWFKIKSSKSVPSIQNFLKKIKHSIPVNKNEKKAQAHEFEVQFSVIELVSDDQNSAVISFRGKDQRGALLAATSAIYNAGLEILSAKVHTWGRQIDDVFTVNSKNQQEAIQKLIHRQQIDGLITKVSV